MKRVEEFEVNGEPFIYFNFDGMKGNEELTSVVQEFSAVVERYEPNSVYTITHLGDFSYDTKTKELLADYMKHNKPYVKKAAILGADGMKRIMLTGVLKLSGRSTAKIFYTRQEAIDWLLSSE